MHLEQPSKGLIDCGVDWITVSSADSAGSRLLEQEGLRLLEQESHKGQPIRPWAMSGYEGFGCGHVSVAEYNGRVLVRAGAEVAHQHWSTLFALSESCSRLDCQVTLGRYSDPQRLIHQCFKQARSQLGKFKRPPAVDLWASNNGSSTLYLNKRSSNQFGRVYDKGRESRLDYYQGCVRFEVEFKSDAARQVAHAIAGKSRQSTDAAAHCSGFFDARGIRAPAAFVSGKHIVLPRSKPDVARRLEWLSVAVRPAVLALVALGYHKEVVAALGLSHES